MIPLAPHWAPVLPFPDGQDGKQEGSSNRGGNSGRLQGARQQGLKRSCWANGKSPFSDSVSQPVCLCVGIPVCDCECTCVFV